MKILYLTDAPVPSRTANSIQSMHMCEAVTRLGHDVVLYCRKTDDTSDKDVFSYYGVTAPFRLFRQSDAEPKGFAEFFDNHLSDVQPELIFSRSVTGIQEAMSSKVTRQLPIIYEAHVPPQSESDLRTLRALFVGPQFRQLVCISSALALEYRRQFSSMLSPEQVTVSHSCARAPIAGHVEGLPLPGRAAALKVGYTGHLYPGKGGELVVELAKRRFDIDFHIFGGMDEDIARLRAANSAENLYIHGFIPPSQIMRAQHSLDVLMLPYQRRVLGYGSDADLAPWMSPLKMFESLSAGKPIIASRLPVLQEILADEVSALLAAPECIEEWSHALDRLASNETLRESLAENAKRLAATCTWDFRAQTIFGNL
jgi:glycosyltransferase involved in cell wall biosynthesis